MFTLRIWLLLRRRDSQSVSLAHQLGSFGQMLALQYIESLAACVGIAIYALSQGVFPSVYPLNVPVLPPLLHATPLTPRFSMQY